MPTCRSCNAEITWALSKKNRRIPLDPVPVPGGNLELVDTGAGERAVVREPESDVPRYVSHFVTCPNANAHRKGRP